MENQKGNISLLDSGREKAGINKRSLRKEARITAETDLREYGTHNWASFQIRHVLLFVEYRFPRAVNEYALCCDAFGTDSVYYFCSHCEITSEASFKPTATTVVSWIGITFTKPSAANIYVRNEKDRVVHTNFPDQEDVLFLLSRSKSKGK